MVATLDFCQKQNMSYDTINAEIDSLQAKIESVCDELDVLVVDEKGAERKLTFGQNRRKERLEEQIASLKANMEAQNDALRNLNVRGM
jgi:peptidoglycan hydrolase CwlO-like protein